MSILINISLIQYKQKHKWDSHDRIFHQDLACTYSVAHSYLPPSITL